MLEHAHAEAKRPRRVVVIGAGGFVGGAIVRELTREHVPVLGLTRKEVDLTAADAAAVLTDKIEADDSIVFVSAMAPARTSAMLLQNLQMAQAFGQALSAKPAAHVVY